MSVAEAVMTVVVATKNDAWEALDVGVGGSEVTATSKELVLQLDAVTIATHYRARKA